MRILATVLFFMAFTLNAAEKHTQNTYKLSDGEQPPKATLEDVSWLVGAWQGTIFGSKFEEVWNPESADTMVGMLKIYNDEGGVLFYEILLLIEEDDSIAMLVKHFNADFSAWEEKKEYVKFKLAKLEENAVHFSGLSFYKKGDDAIEGYLVMKQKDGSVTENPIYYKRTHL